MHGWLGGSLDPWVGLGQMIKNLDLIKMILVGSGQMTNNLINFDIIKIIQFCLKIYYL